MSAERDRHTCCVALLVLTAAALGLGGAARFGTRPVTSLLAATLSRVPRRSRAYQVPRDWVVEGSWPTGRFSPEAPEIVAYAVEVASRLRAAIAGMNKTKLSQRAEIKRSTLYDVLAGTSWVDTVTLAKLETTLGVRLWPEEPPVLSRVTAPTPPDVGDEAAGPKHT